MPRHDALDLLTTLARPSDPAHTLDPTTRTIEPAVEVAIAPGVERDVDDSAEDAARDPAAPAAAPSGATGPDGVGRDSAEGVDSTGGAVDFRGRCLPGRRCRCGSSAG